MKFGRFLIKVQKLLQFQVEIDLKTVKLVIKVFEECLSPKEIKRWNTELGMIRSYKSFQDTL